MYIMTLKIKFIPKPNLNFLKKIELFYYCYNLYIYNLFNRAHFVSYFVSGFVSAFSNTKNIKYLTYRVMCSLNTLYLCLILCRALCLILCPSPYQREISSKKHSRIASKPLNGLMAASYLCNTKSISSVILQRTVLNLITRKNMERSVAYSLVRRRDFKDPDGNEKLYYAQAQARGEMGIREIGQRLEQMCTLTYADIMAVLCALPSVIRQGLASGEIVRLGDLGYLQIGLKSKGAKTEKEFTNSLIKKAKFRFRPGKDMSDLVTSLNYERVPVRKKKGE